MADRTLRGMRLGAQSMQSEEGVEFASRQRAQYRTAEGESFIEHHRVRLQNYFPVARFGASFYIRTRDRFAIQDEGVASHSTPIDEIR